jgi:hypothetical protein
MNAASNGYEPCLQAVKQGYMVGFVTNEDFAQTVRSYQSSIDASKSESRDKGMRIYNERFGRPFSSYKEEQSKRY